MRICMLQSRYTSDHVLKDHDEYMDPGRYVRQHTFHHHFVDKAEARAQIDAAVADGYDFYLNFLWGQPEDEVAGVEASEYFESLGVPFIGVGSRVLRKSKTELYEAARKRGSPPVPGADAAAFPVLVKAARSCASQFLSAKSLCHTAEERDAAIADIDRQLEPGRLRALQGKPRPSHGPSVEKVPDDIIVQEFVPGTDFSVVVVEFGTTPVALNPTIYNYPPAHAQGDNRFLTFDIKFHPELSESLVQRERDPVLYELLQTLAVEAFDVNAMAGGGWANVDIRVRPDGRPVVIEVNPMPAIFLPERFMFEDSVIRHSLPGQHRALLNIVMASYLMRSHEAEKHRRDFIGTAYDGVAEHYDAEYCPRSTVKHVIGHLLANFDFGGTVLDLACGTGVFGRMLLDSKPSQHRDKLSDGAPNGAPAEMTRLVGLDVSPQMARLCQQHGYDEGLVGSLQERFPAIREPFDHIVCFQAIHFVSSCEVSLVLARAFQLALKSVTVGVDEIPDEYNRVIRAKTPPWNLMTSINHVQEVRDFGVPRGWRLAYEKRDFGWNSPAAQVDVYSTVFHYERI